MTVTASHSMTPSRFPRNTLQARAIEILTALPTGGTITVSQLAVEIGRAPMNSRRLLSRLVSKGIALEHRGGSKLGYSLIEETPREANAETEMGDGPMQTRVAARDAAPIEKRGPSSVFDLATTPIASTARSTRNKVDAAPAPVASSAAAGLSWKAPASTSIAVSARGATSSITRSAASISRSTPVATPLEPPSISCALFNTGELLIETATDRLRLTNPQARALVDYLERLRDALEVSRA